MVIMDNLLNIVSSCSGSTVMLIDCLNKVGVIGNLNSDTSNIHAGLLVVGAMLMCRESRIVHFYWFLILHKMCFYTVTTTSQQIAIVIAKSPQPTISKLVQVSIIIGEVFVINMIGFLNGWDAINSEILCYYFAIFSITFIYVRLGLELYYNCS
jgi:hypothetical protein